MTPTDLPRDPLERNERSNVVRDGDWVFLYFADESKKVLCECSLSGTIRVAKSKCSTKNLVGLEYGRVVEHTKNGFIALDPSEKLIPDISMESLAATTSASTTTTSAAGNKATDDDEQQGTSTTNANNPRDNRSIVDTNTAQKLDRMDLARMKESEMDKTKIVSSIIENSKTFEQKTVFSQQKYVRRKQEKYISRCRIVRCTGRTLCQYMHSKDPKRMLNLRDDSLGQILAYANLSAGCQTLVLDTCMGVVTGSVAERLAGYGRLISIYDGVQPRYQEQLGKFNFSFLDQSAVHWVHSGDIFGERSPDDSEVKEREAMEWPCFLQSHTRNFVETQVTEPKKREAFMQKRASRFMRKLCRSTPFEARQYLDDRYCDSIIIACHYDPVQTLLPLLPFLAPSCPFVVYCEYLEPLVACFQKLQEGQLAINLRLCDTWMREYQVLEGRTHPFMHMSQNGGFILTGIRLHELTGRNDLDDDALEAGKLKWRKMRRNHLSRRPNGSANVAKKAG